MKNIGEKGLKTGSYKDDMAGSDEDEHHDAYLERMKAEGKERDEDDDETDSSGWKGTFFTFFNHSLLVFVYGIDGIRPNSALIHTYTTLIHTYTVLMPYTGNVLHTPK